jgi:hypothetical protein
VATYWLQKYQLFQDYQVPFAVTGKIDKVTISVAPPVLTEADKQKLEAAYRAEQDAN